jgi:hypothetical protein
MQATGHVAQHVDFDFEPLDLGGEVAGLAMTDRRPAFGGRGHS